MCDPRDLCVTRGLCAACIVHVLRIMIRTPNVRAPYNALCVCITRTSHISRAIYNSPRQCSSYPVRPTTRGSRPVRPTTRGSSVRPAHQFLQNCDSFMMMSLCALNSFRMAFCLALSNKKVVFYSHVILICFER